VLAGLVTGCCLVTGCSAAAVRESVPVVHGPGVGVPSAYATGPDSSGGTTATDQVAQSATRAFGDQVDAATASFVASVAALQADAASGNIVEAKFEEIVAQSAYDGFRDLDASNAVNVDTVELEPATRVVWRCTGGPDEVFRGFGRPVAPSPARRAAGPERAVTPRAVRRDG
jgi:hypothetical protein